MITQSISHLFYVTAAVVSYDLELICSKVLCCYLWVNIAIWQLIPTALAGLIRSRPNCWCSCVFLHCKCAIKQTFYSVNDSIHICLYDGGNKHMYSISVLQKATYPYVSVRQVENSWYFAKCFRLLVWKRLKLGNAVILAEVYQHCTALNGKQRPRPGLYYNMALIKTRLVCLWMVLSHGQFLLRDKTVYVMCSHPVC